MLPRYDDETVICLVSCWPENSPSQYIFIILKVVKITYMMTFSFFFSSIRRVVVLLVATLNVVHNRIFFFSTGKQPKMVVIFYKTIIVLLLTYLLLHHCFKMSTEFLTLWFKVAFLVVTFWPGWLEGDGLTSTMLVARGSKNTQHCLENYSVCTINRMWVTIWNRMQCTEICL